MGLFADYEPLRRGGPPPEGLVTRVASPADVPALAALRVARGDATEEQATAGFRRWLARGELGEAVVLAAELGSTVVGYGTAERLAMPEIPSGWYLGGMIVSAAFRRRGIGARLTRERLAWIATRADRAFYFVNARNLASIDLHAPFGFREVARGIRVPGVTFTDGIGLLFATDLPKKG